MNVVNILAIQTLLKPLREVRCCWWSWMNMGSKISPFLNAQHPSSCLFFPFNQRKTFLDNKLEFIWNEKLIHITDTVACLFLKGYFTGIVDMRLGELLTGGDSDGWELAQSVNPQLTPCKLIWRHHILWQKRYFAEKQEDERENLLTHLLLFTLLPNTNSVFHGHIKIFHFILCKLWLQRSDLTAHLNHL